LREFQKSLNSILSASQIFEDLWIVWPFIAFLQMEYEPLDDWIASLSPIHSLRQIARIVHVGLNRVGAVRDAIYRFSCGLVRRSRHDAGTKEDRMTQPLISAGKTEVPPEYAEVVKTPATWNEQLDEILVRMVDERGRRYKVISGRLGDFTESEYKNWWMFLTNLKRLKSGGVMFAPH
jgi:hypothetical protein